MNSRRPIVGVMGAGANCPPDVAKAAELVGRLIATQGWVLLNGGEPRGVMAASSQGAASAGGIVVGILPTAPGEGKPSPHVTIPIYTGMGDGRNHLNALSSDVLIAMWGAEGTIAEIALALKAGRHVILLGFDDRGLFRGGSRGSRVHVASTPEEAIRMCGEILSGR